MEADFFQFRSRKQNCVLEEEASTMMWRSPHTGVGRTKEATGPHPDHFSSVFSRFASWLSGTSITEFCESVTSMGLSSRGGSIRRRFLAMRINGIRNRRTDALGAGVLEELEGVDVLVEELIP